MKGQKFLLWTKYNVLIFLAIFFILSTTSLKAQTEEPNVRVTGRTAEYNLPAKRLHVVGDVNLAYEEITIETDRLEYGIESGEGAAAGNIIIILPHGVRITGDQAEFNLKTGWWKTPYAHINIEPSVSIICEGAEQKDSGIINLKGARITTCQTDKPFWEIRGKEGMLNISNSVRMKGLNLRIKGVPVFYLPVAYVPLVESKLKGLQPPEFGHSKRYGHFINNSLSWPISSQTEGVINLDYFTETGIGLGIGWESLKNETKLRGEQNDLGTIFIRDVQKSRGKLYLLYEEEKNKLHGKADISLDMGRSTEKRLAVDINYTTQRDYRRNFSIEGSERDIEIEESRLFFSNYKPYITLLAGFQHIRTLYESPEDETLIRPELSGYIRPTPIKINALPFDPLFSMNISCAYAEWDANMTSGEGEILSIKPEILIPILKNPWFTMNSSLSTLQAYSRDANNSGTARTEKNDLDIILTGPKFNKTYQEGIIHMLYPQVSYELAKQGRDPPLSILNIEEEMEGFEDVTLSIINHFRGNAYQGKGMGLKNIDLILSQIFGLEEEREIFKAHIIAQVHQSVSLKAGFATDTKGGDEKNTYMSINLGDAQGGNIAVDWRYLQGAKDIQNINTALLSFITKTYRGYRFSASFKYDFEADENIENRYSLLYEGGCWKTGLHYINRFDEDIFRFNFNLLF